MKQSLQNRFLSHPRRVSGNGCALSLKRSNHSLGSSHELVRFPERGGDVSSDAKIQPVAEIMGRFTVRATVGLAAILLRTSWALAEGSFYAHIPNLQEKEKEIALSTESVKAVLLHSTTAQSVHLVQIRTRERRHIHLEHDLTALVRQGRGTIVLGSLHRKVKAGDVIVIPRGVIHQMINEGKAPALAIVVFSPPFDGKDFVPAPSATLPRPEP